jgi:hypothetical protein
VPPTAGSTEAGNRTSTPAVDTGTPGAVGMVPVGDLEPNQLLLHRGLLVVSDLERFTAFDIVTGAVAWRSTACPGAREVNLIGGRDGRRVLVSCEEGVRMLDLDVGRFEWSGRRTTDHSSLRMGGDALVLAFEDAAEVYDPASGRLRFRWDAPAGARPEVAVAADAERVYVGTDAGVVAFDADGRQQWRAAVDALSMGTDGEVVVVRSPEASYWMLDAATGEPRAHTTPNAVHDEGAIVVEVDRGLALVAALSGSPTGEQHFIGLDTTSGDVRWQGSGGDLGRYVTAGSGVLVVETSRCRALGLDDGEEVAACPGSDDAVAVADDRIAWVDRDDPGGTRIEVRRIPG